MYDESGEVCAGLGIDMVFHYVNSAAVRILKDVWWSFGAVNKFVSRMMWRLRLQDSVCMNISITGVMLSFFKTNTIPAQPEGYRREELV